MQIMAAVLRSRSGPFELEAPGATDAYGRTAELWGAALANLRARIDFGADLRRPVR